MTIEEIRKLCENPPEYHGQLIGNNIVRMELSEFNGINRYAGKLQESVNKLLARVEELERSKLDIIKSFVEDVNRIAEDNMLKTGKLEGAHHTAMKKRLKEIEAEIAEVEQ